jgi:alpha-maltose-1-phosphate synthase
MRAAVISREYPPEIYGGAGVHVEFLVRELRRLIDVDVHCFGGPRSEPNVYAYPVPPSLASANAALQTLGVDIEMTAGTGEADIVHSHTWYANLAGHLSSLMYDVPHVVTAHSLEPMRPWKAEQLGGGYRLSSWAERTAYEAAAAVVAVSNGMAEDILHCYPAIDSARVHIIPNGIDAELYAPVAGRDVLHRYGLVTDRPIALFVGRITRQKGVGHLVAAARRFDADVQLALCAGSPDTAELAAEITAAVSELSGQRDGVVWIQDMLPRSELLELLTAADVFVCPSIYEPQGIVNLEAMACQTAVVASRVGGIPDVVVDGVTGLLVDYDRARPEDFQAGLAQAVNELVHSPEVRVAFGLAGRRRVETVYGWPAIAERTVQLYSSLV